jgi:hypothetical protein
VVGDFGISRRFNFLILLYFVYHLCMLIFSKLYLIGCLELYQEIKNYFKKNQIMEDAASDTVHLYALISRMDRKTLSAINVCWCDSDRCRPSSQQAHSFASVPSLKQKGQNAKLLSSQKAAFMQRRKYGEF